MQVLSTLLGNRAHKQNAIELDVGYALLLFSVITLFVNHRLGSTARLKRASMRPPAPTAARTVGARRAEGARDPRRSASSVADRAMTPFKEEPATPSEPAGSEPLREAAPPDVATLRKVVTATATPAPLVAPEVTRVAPAILSEPSARDATSTSTRRLATTGRWEPPATSRGPGWHPDPGGTPNTLRYFDGSTWTEHLARRG